MSVRTVPRVIAVAMVFAGCTESRSPDAQVEVANGRPVAAESLAVLLERGVTAVAAEHVGPAEMWPGFDPMAVPLAVYDGERTYLFRHPSPPGEFQPTRGATRDSSARAVVMSGRHEAMTANSSAAIGGVQTATVLLDAANATNLSIPRRVPLAIHEAFHVFQRAHHPGWAGNEADLFVYPTDNAGLLALRRLETEALRRALASDAKYVAACWARRAVELRRQRYSGLDSASVSYERGTELNEGIATYVEGKVAGGNTVVIPQDEFSPADVRLRAYATGPAIALLLDKFSPGWPASFESNDRQTLDGALERALPKSAANGAACAFSSAEHDAASRRADRDVAALSESRRARMAAFSARAGWRLIVDAAASAMWPQGFDPINVERVGPTSVLHTRFAKLGNDAGSVEFLDSPSTDLEGMTTGVGPHPLFNGVRRVEVVGLSEPEVTESDGSVKVRAPGVTAVFSGARVVREGQTISIKLGTSE